MKDSREERPDLAEEAMRFLLGRLSVAGRGFFLGVGRREHRRLQLHNSIILQSQDSYVRAEIGGRITSAEDEGRFDRHVLIWRRGSCRSWREA